MRIALISAVIMLVAVLMAMTGRGGGNFYVPILVAAGASMHQAATSGQLILLASALAAMLVFQKHRTVDWKLALVIDPPTDVMAFFGGYYAHQFSGLSLKLVFAFLLVVAAFFMLRPVKEPPARAERHFGFWRRNFGGRQYVVNLWLTIPITAATGFVAGMVGISGGSFKVPLMVIACGVPMRVAVGTSSAMVAATALMGFIGHTLSGDFEAGLAVPAAIAGLVGGFIGGMVSLKTSPKSLRALFGLTTLGAAVFMALNALLS
ncbi:MAG: sulfite exporter TauE/SafE family protein [Planctomycetes bacterium]|nr:sulfite exporter TauE/SafE family protein [Planctomycetota bacterium]